MAKLSDVGMAYAAERLSHWSVRWPWLGNIVHGRDPRVRRAAWDYVPDHMVEERDGPWVRVGGDPRGTRLPWPARYRRVACVGFSLEQAAVVDKDKPVTLAFKVGGAVMATTLTPERSALLRWRRHVYMRVGRAAAEFAIGQRDSNGTLVLGGATEESPGSVNVMPLDQAPANAVMY